MFCKNCGAKRNDTAKFCNQCGEEFAEWGSQPYTENNEVRLPQETQIWNREISNPVKSVNGNIISSQKSGKLVLGIVAVLIIVVLYSTLGHKSPSRMDQINSIYNSGGSSSGYDNSSNGYNDYGSSSGQYDNSVNDYNSQLNEELLNNYKSSIKDYYDNKMEEIQRDKDRIDEEINDSFVDSFDY